MRSLHPGDHFGEIALINNVKRTLTVRSVSNSQLLSLKRDSFERILGSIKKYLKDDYLYNEKDLECNLQKTLTPLKEQIK